MNTHWCLLSLMSVFAFGCGPDGPSLSLSVGALEFSAVTTCRTPPPQAVKGSVTGVTHGTLYLTITSTGPAVGSISNFSVTSTTTAEATVFPASADVLGRGTFTSTITVRACLDDPSCASGQLAGSPKTINVTYEIESVGVTDAPSAYTITGWQTMTSNAPFLSDFRLGAIGGTLYVVSPGFYSHIMETWQSTDLGVTWKSVAVEGGPTTAVKDFALAASPNALFLSGGSTMAAASAGVPNNQVWRFDGTTWTQAAVAAPFPARDRHVMVWHGARLYLLGGQSGTTWFNDVWVSEDEGVTWRSVAAAPFTPRFNPCAVSWHDSLYVLGGDNILPSDIWRSTDGVSWELVPVPPSSPFVDAARFSAGRCATLSDRIYEIGEASGNRCVAGGASSANGTDWQFEPSISDPFPSPGAVSMDGHIYLAGGDGTSVRSVYRSLP